MGHQAYWFLRGKGQVKEMRFETFPEDYSRGALLYTATQHKQIHTGLLTLGVSVSSEQREVSTDCKVAATL